MAEPEDRRWEEYKLLQAKVDGIGTFKFQIRGWAITLMVAFLVSGIAAKIPAMAFLSGLIVVGLFYLLDSNQQVWGTAYLKRLRDLEALLVKGSHESWRNRSPGIVLATGTVGRGRFRKFLLRRETGLFYLLLAALILGCTVYSSRRERTNDDKPTKIQIVSPPEASISGAQK